MNLGPQLTRCVLETETERVRMIPVHEEQVIATVAIHVEDLNGLDRAGVGKLLRLGQASVGLLQEHVDVLLGEQQDARRH